MTAEIGDRKGDYSSEAIIIERHNCQIAGKEGNQKKFSNCSLFTQKGQKVENGFGSREQLAYMVS